MVKQHEHSSNELEKVWKEKEDLIYEVMFGKNSLIAKPGEDFGKEEPISIWIKESKDPLLSDQNSNNMNNSNNNATKLSIA